jgi:hypothetical protein
VTPRDDREYLRQAVRNAAPEVPLLVPIHLSGCQNIADCFLVNRETVRAWKRAGAPIALIGGRLTAEYNMLMHWHVRQSANGTEVVR